MLGRTRRRTRAQAQRENPFAQDSFGGGQNTDSPASKLKPGQTALLRNVIDRGDYLEGHGGSLRLSSTNLPGSGTVYDLAFHPTAKKWLLHRGTGLWTAPATITAWTEVKSIAFHTAVTGPTEAGDTSNQLSSWILCGANSSNTNAGVLYWTLTNAVSTRTINLYKDAAKTQLVAAGTLVGDGTLFLLMQNSSGLFGSVVVAYTGNDTDSGNTLTLTSLEQSFYNVASRIVQYKNDFLVFLSNASLDYVGSQAYVNLTDGKYYSLGAARYYGFPAFTQSDSGSQAAATPYGRRYLATYSRIVNASGAVDYTLNRVTGTLVFEGPTNDLRSFAGGLSRDYGETWFANPISAGNPNTVDIYLGQQAAAHYTHISLYGTLDIGAAGVDPMSGLGNNRELYVWIADIEISQVSFSDTVTDDVLRSRLAKFPLRTRFWKNIPPGECGAIVNDFLFQAPRGTGKVPYQQLLYPEYMGFHRPDAQFMTFDDGVQILAESNEQLAIICSRQTWTVNPKVTKNIDRVAAVFTLPQRFPASRTIGVTDWGSFAYVENGGFIARCTDGSVRIWDGSAWGEDLGDERVRKTLLNMIDGSAAGYSKNAYYLWYRTSSGDAYNTKCLRLGLGGEAGFGWSEIARATWLFPHLRVGAVVQLDAANLARLMVLDYATGHIYWIETFTNASSSFTKAWKDKENVSNGTDIAGTIRFREFIGARESDTLYHEETHTYFRPAVPADGYLSGFAVGLNVYADGAATAVASASGVPKDGDIQVSREARGRRIQVEITTATSKFHLAGMDSVIQIEDKAAIGQQFSETDEAAYQLALASNLKHWLCRPYPRLNRATGTNYTLVGTAPTQVTGPDGKSYALSFVSGAEYNQVDTLQYTDFSLCFWCKSVPLNTILIRIDGLVDNFFVMFTSNTAVNVNGDGTLTVSTIASGWHNFWFVRSGSTVSAYQNGVLIGTTTTASIVGDIQFQVNQGRGACQYDDVRLYNAVKSAAAIAYYYDDVVNVAGKRLLPLA